MGSEVGRAPGRWGVPQVTGKRGERILGREREIHRSWSAARLGRVFWVLMMWEHTWGGAGSWGLDLDPKGPRPHPKALP